MANPAGNFSTAGQKSFQPTRKLPEGFLFRALKETNAYVYHYKGPYHYLILVFHKILLHLEHSGAAPNGPLFEIYQKGPQDGISEFEYVTQIVFPINKFCN